MQPEKQMWESNTVLWMQEGILPQVGARIAAQNTARRAVVVSDENVWKLYGELLTEGLKQAGIVSFPIILPSGEKGKSGENYLSILGRMADIPLTRKELLIAFGGGVVGDIAGFCAATYMRGISFVQIPTTLVGQIDSAIGGKNAINLPQGKNLAGSFYPPQLVCMDHALLQTLPPREFSSGMGEMVKYALLMGDPLLSLLQAEPTDTVKENFKLGEMIALCCQYKEELVRRDPFDHGERALLNLGHTFGHGIETMTGFTQFTHGEAVAMGLLYSAVYSHLLGYCSAELYQEVANLCLTWNLPVQVPVDIQGMLSCMYHDKKADATGVNLVLMKKSGDCMVQYHSFTKLQELAPQVERILKQDVWKQ